MIRTICAASMAAALAIVAAPAASAQDASTNNIVPASGKMYRIGMLNYASGGATDLIKKLLAQRGYVEGKNVTYDIRTANRDKTAVDQAAIDLVAWKPDVIVSLMSNADLALKKALVGKKVPVVVWSTDPQSVGVVASHRRPGGNFTGFSYEPYQAMLHLRLLKLAVPNLTSVCYLYNHTYVVAPHELEEFREAAKLMNTKVIVFEALEKPQVIDAFARMSKSGCGAVAIGPHELFNTNGPLVGGLARQYKFATIGLQTSIVRGGGLAAYAPPFERGWPAMAEVIARIINGADPATIPVERGFKSPLTINMQTARYLKLTLPADLVDEADTLIE